MARKDLGYAIIDECKCGFEEFSVLVSLIDPEDPQALAELVDTIVRLVDEGVLISRRNSTELPQITREDLEAYLSARLGAAEDLEEYPEVVPELSFMATNQGILLLREEDRPV
ncbi:MAG TPA: hypothetical protein VN811_06135 [Thermoanaerobaculia bacterium]|nr:hypothetical protein [Thermoanaerobaculia bacterium]